nr:DUF3168 domain-containing protein [Sphingomonas sp. Y57]
MEEWLREQLLAAPGLAALVANRIDWGVRPTGDPYPGVALHLISDVPEIIMSGFSGWHDARVQADCWALSPGQSVLVGRQLVLAAQGIRQTVDGKKYRTFVIDANGHAEDDEGRIAHRTRVDLRVHYQA